MQSLKYTSRDDLDTSQSSKHDPDRPVPETERDAVAAGAQRRRERRTDVAARSGAGPRSNPNSFRRPGSRGLIGQIFFPRRSHPPEENSKFQTFFGLFFLFYYYCYYFGFLVSVFWVGRLLSVGLSSLVVEASMMRSRRARNRVVTLE